MVRTLSLSLAIALAGSSLPAQQPAPADPGVTGVVKGEGFTRIRIAVPDVEAEPGAEAVAREITAVLRDDLAFSGYFDVVDPATYAMVATSKEKTVAARWLSIGAAALVSQRAKLAAGRIDLRARLEDTQQGAKLFETRYGGTVELARRVAHQVADDIVKHFTGRPGVALTRIAFTSKHGAGKEIYLMDYDGARVRRITTTGTINLAPAWSPSSDRLAFISWRGGAPSVYVLDTEGTLTRIPVLTSELNSSPDWSPDGRKLVYTSLADGNAELFVLDLTTGKNTRLTRSPGIDTSPAWSPNGREIAFTSDRSGTPQIYLVDADGLNLRRVTTDGNYSDSAAWSPRGDKLAYVTRVDRRFQIQLMDVASGAVAAITSQGNNENPRFSPDGRHLVFASDRAGSYDIYTMATDGSGVRRLTRGGDAFTPDWSR
jgi:TolB protein